MALFLRSHARNQLGFGAIAAEHGKLPRVNAGRAIFSGLVDAEHRGAVGQPVTGAPAAHARRPRNVRSRISKAPPSESIAFQPASVMPRKRNCTSSQRTSGACVISFSKSAGLLLLVSAVH